MVKIYEKPCFERCGHYVCDVDDCDTFLDDCLTKDQGGGWKDCSSGWKSWIYSDYIWCTKKPEKNGFYVVYDEYIPIGLLKKEKAEMHWIAPNWIEIRAEWKEGWYWYVIDPYDEEDNEDEI